MLHNLRQSQFALARHLRDPISAPLPEGVNAKDAAACSQEMVINLRDVLDPIFPMTYALLGGEMWELAVRLFLKDASHHGPWASAVQRAFIAHVCESQTMQHLPAWLPDIAHYEWLQRAVSNAPVAWPDFDADGDLMQYAVVLNPTHVEAAYDWPVHMIDTDNPPNDMQNTYLTVLRDLHGDTHVFESSVVRGQVLGLLRAGQTGAQAFMAVAHWLAHPEPQVLVQEGAHVMAQLKREGVVLGVRG